MYKSAWSSSVPATFVTVVLALSPVGVIAQRRAVSSSNLPKVISNKPKKEQSKPGKAQPTPKVAFSNPAAITISGFNPASPYPSNITVSGLTQNISSVTLTLTGFSHVRPDDLDMLLVSPIGSAFHFWSDAGGATAISNLNITLDDTALIALPDDNALTSFSYRPANYPPADSNFPGPAPVGPYNQPTPTGTATFTSSFGGLTPAQANGTWSLYIFNNQILSAGSISGGWSLNITQATVFSNPAAITINDDGVATPYPSNITVSGLTQNIASVKLTLTGFRHPFPSDVDMLLVAPNGTAYVFWSDPTSFPVLDVDFALDDNATLVLPGSGVFTGGTFRPASYAPSDTFPGPAPPPLPPYAQATDTGTATFTSVFGGLTPAQANGDWSLYVVDDELGDFGHISGGWSLAITEAPAAAAPTAGQIIISEFRVRGPGGANDEFIELYNNSGADLTVGSLSGTGLGVAASDGVTRCTVPNGTVIPAAGHYLCVNSADYSLASYPAGNGTTATGDATYTTDIPDNAGIAIFNNNTGGGSYSLANRLDAVGSTSEANTLYKEGTGYPALGLADIDYAFYRDTCGKGGSSTVFGACSHITPKDTDVNSADFIFVDPNGTDAGVGQRLGAPGPENLSSPITRAGNFVVTLLDPCVGTSSPPNRVRDFTSDPPNNSTFGTLEMRRTFTNNTGANITRLRYRVVDLTTFPAPPGIADLRPRTSPDVVVTVDRAPCGSGTSNITVFGTTLEQPPGQPNGGGFNSSMSQGTITLGTPLAPGASIDMRWLLGIQQTGSFKFYVNMEALP